MIAKFIGKEGEPITRKELKAFQKRISLGRKTRIKRKALGQIDQLLNKKVKRIPNLKHNKPFKDEIKKRNAQKLKRKSSYQKREVVLTGKKGIEWKKVMSGKEIVSMLKKNGFVQHSQDGSHLHLVKPGITEKVTVPIHGNDDINIQTYKNIQNQVNTVLAKEKENLDDANS